MGSGCVGDMNPTHFSDEYGPDAAGAPQLVGHSMWVGPDLESAGKQPAGPVRSINPSIRVSPSGELGDMLTITVTATSKKCRRRDGAFDCRAVNQRDEKSSPRHRQVKAPTRNRPMRITLCHHATAQQNRFREADRSSQGLEEHPHRRSPSCSKEALEAHRCHKAD